MVLPPLSGEVLLITITRSLESFDLVKIDNIGAGPFTIDSVGIWFPGLSMGLDFGPSRISQKHPFPGYPVTIGPGESVIYTINVAEIENALLERQDRIVDFTYFVGSDHNTRHYSLPVSVAAYLRALEPNPLAQPGPDDGGVFQA